MIIEKDKENESSKTLIFAINLTSHYYEVYSEQGILVQYVDYKYIVNEYGLPV